MSGPFKTLCPFFFIVVIFLTTSTEIFPQAELITGKLEASAGYISPDAMPFWLRSNQSGDVPLHKASMGYLGAVKKQYNEDDNPIFDWGAAFEARLNVGQQSNVTLIEGYAKMRLFMFQLKAGRSRDMMGMADSTLSAGAFSVSGNAPGIPKIEISIPEFYTLPFLGRLFAFQGNFVHGWVGETPIRWEGDIIPTNSYLHQKSLYGRFGKESWKLRLLGGFNHQVYWGNERSFYGDIYTLNDWQTAYYVAIGRAYGNQDIPRSKVGNHLGSIDLGLEYFFSGVKLYAYRQNLYEVGALYYLANIRDGLNGLSLTNINEQPNGFKWEKIVLEFFYTKNQAGELWSPLTPSGDENYYNNFQYYEGWSYKGMGIGNPFIGTREYIREKHPSNPSNYFINNRVIVFHSGFEASLNNLWSMMLKASYSLNYGTYGTSEIGHSLGNRRTPPRYGIFQETSQFSTIVDVSRAIGNQMNVGVTAAFDNGGLYYNSAGFLVRVERSF